MKFKRSSHSVYQCQYHLVWTTKYRKRALTDPEVRSHIEAILRRAGAEYGMEIFNCEVDLDHVHIYMEIPPQRSVGSAVRILKSISARLTFKRYPNLKGKFWSGELWGDGYFTRTVGEGVTAAIVRNYLDQHETKGTESAQGELFPKEKIKLRQ